MEVFEEKMMKNHEKKATSTTSSSISPKGSFDKQLLLKKSGSAIVICDATSHSSTLLRPDLSRSMSAEQILTPKFGHKAGFHAMR